MPHIALPQDMPGITGGFAFRPGTAKPMRELAHVLIHSATTVLAHVIVSWSPCSCPRATPATFARPVMARRKLSQWRR